MNEGIQIRNFKLEDYQMIRSWWEAAKQPCPNLGNMPPNTTYILSLNEVPLLAATLFLTNVEFAWVDNLIGNPKMKEVRAKHKLVKLILSHMERVAKGLDFEMLFCMSIKRSTSRLYESLGFSKACSGVETFVKEIK